jgi:phosphoribosylglycinamide formyltransferase 1
MKKIAIFASGAGSNAQKIIDHFHKPSGNTAHKLNKQAVEVALIVSNKPTAGVLWIAEKENIPTLIIDKERFLRDGYVSELQERKIDFVVLAGFLWKIPQALIDAYRNRIINIHPALLPKYGGKGMYGNFVHEAVVNAKEAESGITIHYVDEHYDNGDIIFQAQCPVHPFDTPEMLAERIHTLEHKHYPVVIEELVSNLS